MLEGLITGMGFIGGGAILRQQDSVKGTATAASLWVTGAIGAAAGLGSYDVAVVLTLSHDGEPLWIMSPLKRLGNLQREYISLRLKIFETDGGLESAECPPIWRDMTKLSVLDLAPIVEGGDAQQALIHSGRACPARRAARLQSLLDGGASSMPGIASAATAVALAYVGTQTSTIRIGAGGIMLPNHAPLTIAEQFGTLESLFPGRIDLGLGRAPGHGSGGRPCAAPQHQRRTRTNFR